MSIQGSINQMLSTAAAGTALVREGFKGRVEKEQAITDAIHAKMSHEGPKAWQETVDSTWKEGYTPEELKEERGLRSLDKPSHGGIIGQFQDIHMEKKKLRKAWKTVAGPSPEDLTAKEYREWQKWKNTGELRIEQKRDFYNLRDSLGRFTKKGVDNGKH